MFRPEISRFIEAGNGAPNTVGETIERALRGEFYEAKIRQTGTNQCYSCGEEGHYSRQCPKITTQGGQAKISHSQQKTNARIFTLTQDEVNDGSSNVVTGQLSIAGSYAYTLIDSGASHSFASSTFVEKLSVPYEKMGNALNIILPSGDVLLSTYWLKETPIKISDQELYVDLIILEIKDFDVILGMD
ncbi:hypothetical protein UlMin_005277 [Ulmus minor]